MEHLEEEHPLEPLLQGPLAQLLPQHLPPLVPESSGQESRLGMQSLQDWRLMALRNNGPPPKLQKRQCKPSPQRSIQACKAFAADSPKHQPSMKRAAAQNSQMLYTGNEAVAHPS